MNAVQKLVTFCHIVAAVPSPAELSFEHLPSIVLLLRGERLEIEAANAAARAVLGRDPSGRELLGFIHPEERESFTRRLAELRAETTLGGELTLQVPGEGGVPIGYSLRPIEGEGGRILLTARDISRSGSYRRVATLFTNSPDAMAMWDKTGRLLDGNNAFLHLSGITRERLRELEISDVLEGASAVAREPFISRMITVDPALAVHVTPRPVNADEQHVTAAVIVELRAFERSRASEQAASQAQRLEALGRLASGIAHEFNNMLMAALPWADLIRRRYPDDELLVKAAENIRRSVHRARDVTRQLLDFAQPRTPERRPTDLVALLQLQQKLLRSAIPSGLDLDVVTPPGPVLAMVDGAQISQALLNLGLFARDRASTPGTIRLLVENDGKDEIGVLVQWDGDPLNDDQQNMLFDPYSPVDPTGEGGLTLSVAKRIVQQNGGRILVTSGAHRTSLTVLLPVASAAGETERGSFRLPHRADVLLIGLADSHDAVVPLIKSRGVTVRTSSDLDSALTILSSDTTHVLLDLAAIDGSPDEPVAAIRQRSPGVVIIAASGRDDSDLELPTGVRFLRKPFDIDELLNIIAQSLEGERR